MCVDKMQPEVVNDWTFSFKCSLSDDAAAEDQNLVASFHNP